MLYDVVALHGKYFPFKFNLHRFHAINSVTYDFLNSRIFTILTARGGDKEGTMPRIVEAE
ncbi:hypothetical protein ACHAWF_008344 [Thalassiosira exigua]